MSLLEYLSPVRRWWWVLVLGTLVAVGSTFVALRAQPPVYQASSSLMIGRTLSDPNPSYNEMYLVQQLANTYAALAKRTSVRNVAMANLGLKWLPEYSVRLVTNTQLLEITVTSTDPLLAQAAADALAYALVAQSPTQANSEAQSRQGFVTAQLDALEAGIKDTQDEITRIQSRLADLLSAREIADAQAQIAALQSKLRDLQNNYAALLSHSQQGATNTLTVVEPAQLPTVPTGTNRMRTLALAAAIGLILSTGTAYLLSYVDDTLKTPYDVKRSLGLITLGAVPDSENGVSGAKPLMLSGSHSAASEAYRMLRTNLQFAAVEHPLRTLLVTSSAPNEGKSHTTANLAVALAQVGQRVILVDSDLHRPRLHKLFGRPNAAGLSTALLAEHPTADGLLQPTDDPRLRLLTAGPVPPNPTELLGSARMRELLAALALEADIVLLDSPPVLILADALVLSALADGVLLVVQAWHTRRRNAKQAVDTLRTVKASLVGALINRVPTRGADGYYYYYYKDYGYGEPRRRTPAGILERLGLRDDFHQGTRSSKGVAPKWAWNEIPQSLEGLWVRLASLVNARRNHGAAGDWQETFASDAEFQRGGVEEGPE